MAAEMSHAADTPRERRVSGTLVLVTAVLAACSVVYELLAAQTLAALAANTVIWYSVVIGAFLGAMGLGAFRCMEIPQDRDAWRELLGVELRLTLAGAAVVPAIHFGHMLHAYLEVHGWPRVAAVVFFGGAFAITTVVGYLTGIELPLLMRIGAQQGGGTRGGNIVLGVDYVGSLVGALVFPLVILPHTDLLTAATATAGVNLVVALGILVHRTAGRGRLLGPALAAGTLAGLLAAVAASTARIEQYFLRKYYYYTHANASLLAVFAPMPELPEVFRVRSPYQRIDIMQDVDPDASRTLMQFYSTKPDDPEHPRDEILFLNGDFQTNSTYEEIYHEYFAHVPIVATGRVPRHVLLLGGGDGYLARELLKHEGIEDILHVDIDPVLPALAQTHPLLSTVNKGSFRDPRVTHLQGDGFQFVRTTEQRFDAVYIDFPVAVDYDLSRLYSREFFHFVRRCLAPGAFAVFDSTGTSFLTAPDAAGVQVPVEGNDWRIYSNTLVAAGYRDIVPYLTTLEVDNAAAAEWLANAGVNIPVDADFMSDWQAADEEQRKVLRDLLIRRVLTENMIALQQGFVMMAADEGTFGTAWKDPGVPLHLLTKERFEHAFDVHFEVPPVADADFVNSILRPRFPTLPVWRPRRPF
mgnify:CR=1 FL=1